MWPYDWNDLVPESIARQQSVWERGRMVIRMKELGFSHQEIGNRVGLSAERAKDFSFDFRRRGRRRCPVEQWMKSGGEIFALLNALREPDADDIGEAAEKPRVLAGRR